MQGLFAENYRAVDNFPDFGIPTVGFAESYRADNFRSGRKAVAVGPRIMSPGIEIERRRVISAREQSVMDNVAIHEFAVTIGSDYSTDSR